MNNARKIQQLSIAMMWFATGVIILLPLWVLWLWLNFDSYAPLLLGHQGNLVLSSDNITSGQIILAAICHLSATLVMMWGLWNLRELFRQFQHGHFFTAQAVKHLYLFTLILFLSALLRPVISGLLSVILTINNLPGQRALVVSLGSNEVSMMLIAGTLLAISWVMREACRLAEENAGFV